MHTHRLARDGDVVRIYTDGKLTKMAFNTSQTSDIRTFIEDGGLSKAAVDGKLAELFSPIGEAEFQDLK
jgi:hypothetical protein